MGTFDLLSTGAASLGGELLVLTSSAASCSYAMLATPDGGAEPIELAGLEPGRCKLTLIHAQRISFFFVGWGEKWVAYIQTC